MLNESPLTLTAVLSQCASDTCPWHPPSHSLHSRVSFFKHRKHPVAALLPASNGSPWSSGESLKPIKGLVGSGLHQPLSWLLAHSPSPCPAPLPASLPQAAASPGLKTLPIFSLGWFSQVTVPLACQPFLANKRHLPSSPHQLSMFITVITCGLISLTSAPLACKFSGVKAALPLCPAVPQCLHNACV